MTNLRNLYRQMVLSRRLDEECTALHHQGAIYGYAPFLGQEAAQVGSASALDPARDFAFPTYREFAAAVVLGVDPVAILCHHRGYGDGGLFNSADRHVAPLNSVVGGTALHATGWAMGARLDGSDGCALAYFGDGASSQGEVHEAMNFAAIFGAPVIFFCQNNGWAISVPTDKQVGGGSVAARASGYGIPGVRVDGNDVVAVYEATSEAVERARAGDGPTVIEAMTYRLGPHATSDDPSRYRDKVEEEQWRLRDPIGVAHAALTTAGADDEAFFAEVERETAAEIARIRRDFAAFVPATLREQLELVYEQMPPTVRAQIGAWIDAGGPHV
ncbi:pyruvate dehydrogenase E1 component alpha subunit [Acrocarpospora pleiomorpha]|uniref:2-oxoisovalerate dehydrogenase subunit alpha n=1 Tax=Acrocarpospora pleiomorpha TaxID=90975 RepID=A0A5M3XUW5_9ACTN|nr:thiamine pyrophosphate-dependent enzyme [Acrocarpospora pleiomorpha]GES24690.1 pyruvate dehydrogenase E1 component alpha subunit [Acrocarpospora pleiomorpha]